MKTFRLAFWLSTIVLSAIALAPSGPARAADPLGTWYTADKDSQVRITNCGGALCGTPDQWSGNVYNASDGKTYSGSFTMTGPNTAELKGCVMSVICKTQTWTRAN